MVEEIANSEVDAFIEKGLGSGAYVPWHFILQKPKKQRGRRHVAKVVVAHVKKKSARAKVG